jgi:protein-S-isoprenylcysteine O-methyltransferase Ste14
MIQIVVFLVLSIPIVIISWRTLFQFSNHGFYRFLSWECILWLAVNTVPVWFKYPFTFQHVISWVLLFLSLYVVLAGILLMKKHGKAQNRREDDTLYAFEKTSEIVDKGIFAYIRHPLYCSLLLLTWALFFKSPSVLLVAVAVASTAFLFLTALAEEREDILFFGDSYKEYMKRTKMFIPFVL